AELDEAAAVMDQWTRAEPGFSHTTIEELEQRWTREDQERAARRAEEERQRQQRKALYDADREAARLALLEQEAHLAIRQRERDKLQDGTSFPAMPADRRSAKIAECDTAIATAQAEIDRLRSQVGDPETVVDSRGRLPDERRQLALSMFSAHRNVEVRKLRKEIAELDITLQQTRGRAERARIRDQVLSKKGRLDKWIEIAPLAAEDMCADCAVPAAWHYTGQLTLIGEGPCPAWPQWAAKIHKAREMIMSASRRQPTEPPAPKPQPLAVVPSGLPIEEVIARLTELKAEHPHAQVRRGRANRWELWPAPETTNDSPSHG
ncbi:MAG: hypothetical protein ACOC9R_01815, partial [bacterium]